MDTLIIGVGGIGEGVLAHLKLLESSSPANAAQPPSAKLLINSTQPEQHYVLPIAGTQLSVAVGSPEFSPLNRPLQRPIDEIRAGQGPQSLRPWLTPELALLLPERIAEVSIGTGQQAVLSRATVNLEAGRIENEIRGALRRSKQSGGHTLLLVVWGAGSGGTGTGAGLEVLRLARLVADSAGNTTTTVIAVPVLGARGCEHLHERQREVESLHARTAGALFAVACAQSAPHAVVSLLGEGVSLEARQLADLVLVIEGDQGDPTAVQRAPLFGLAQTAAGVIASFIEEQGALAGALPTWRTQAAQVDRLACLGSAGAASIRIDNTLIQRQAELEFARAFYVPLLHREEGTPNMGVARGCELLAAFAPATMVRQVAAHEVVSWSPPARDCTRTMANLVAQLTSGAGEIGTFPSSVNHDVKWLADEVPTTSPLRRVSNAQVVQSTEAANEAYLGDPATRPQRDDAWTVRGWTGASVTALRKGFANLLAGELLSGCLDPSNGLPYTLRQRPLWLLDRVDMLVELRAQIGGLKDAAQAALASGTPLGEQRASQLDEKRSRLLASSRSADLQRDYLKAAQHVLDLSVWRALMEGLIEAAEAWLGEIDRWLAIVGGASGWLTHLQAQDDDVRARAEALLASRRTLAAAANHRYMPGVGDAAERALLDQLVSGSGAVAALQEQCRFVWHSERDGSQELLLEGIPRAPERERAAVVRRLTRSGRALPADYKTTTHLSADLVSYAAEKLADACHSLTIWDGLAYEFEHEAQPIAEREHRVADPLDWVGEVTNHLLQGAAPELGLDGEALEGVFSEHLAWGPLTASGSHPRAAEMARAAAAHLEHSTCTTVETPNASVLRAFSVLLRVPLDACRIYPSLLDALRRVPADQLGLYAPEMAVRRAELLSRVLEGRGILRRPQALSPAAATLCADGDGSDAGLRLAVLATTLEAFDTIPGPGTEEDHVGLIEDGRTRADFGPVGDWVGLIEGMRARGNEGAVAQLQARVDAAIAGHLRGKGASSQSLATQVAKSAEELWGATASVSDRFERDVRLLFYAEALCMADALAAKASKATGA